jgi:small subunit ribosomal protein S9
MAEEPQTPEENQDEQTPEEAPAEEPSDQPASDPAAPGGEAEEADGISAEDAIAEEQTSPPEEEPSEQPVSDPAAPGGEAEEADGSNAEEADGSNAEEADGSNAEEAAGSDAEKAAGSGVAIPGAELDPIALEPDAKLSTEERARLEAEEEERARREAEATAEAPEEEPTAAPRAQLDSGARFRATGKRKRSIARVTLTSGDGKIEVNQRALEEYFPRPQHQTIVRQPLAVTGYEEGVDVRVRVSGGGVSGQAGAVRHGVARALTEIDPELRRDLKRRGFLTRDPRVKERRKAGLKKARKRPQFSKR